ncbi:hypothetical protein diail_2782 [Diaporthe ilicicola]|nr:hypothetical protein diail_2782 [Diaporthe ilicicola]
MSLKNLGFILVIAAIAAFVDTLPSIQVGFVNAVLNDNSVFRDGDTLFAPNAKGETVAHPIVNMTSEIDIPGASAKVNITGTAQQVIAYINTNFPDYVWPDVEELNTTASKVDAEDNQVFCDVFLQGPFPVAAVDYKDLRQLGSHFINVGQGPSACVQASCHTDVHGRTVAIHWCNDVSKPFEAVQKAHSIRKGWVMRSMMLILVFVGQDALSASTSYNTIADLALVVFMKCIEFDTPFSWIRGQAFDTSLPWNVIVTSQDSC